MPPENPREDGQGNPPRPPGAEPKIVRGRYGYSSFSLAALRERIEAQIQEELDGRPDILLQEADEAARRELVRDAGEYVLAVESVPLGQGDREALFDAVYRSLFTFGPLDDLLADDSITDLSIDGYDRVHLQHLGGEPQVVPSPFEDAYHYARVLDRMLTGAGAQLVDSEPFIEVGLTLLGRPARLTLVGPPLSPVLHVGLRLHPRRAVALEILRAQGAITGIDFDALRALAQSPHGALIVGDATAGKTTVLGALLAHLPDPASCSLVERAQEIRPPEGIHRLAAVPARQDRPGVEFPAQVAAALAESPGALILDELRGDEAGPVWEALAKEGGPRCLFVFRSSPEPDRLRSAFSILIRKGYPALDQALIHRALLERVPFVITVQGGAEGLCVASMGEWAEDAAGSLALVPLVQGGRPTGVHPRHALAGLDESFWRT